jgi:predicted phosphodiesterase
MKKWIWILPVILVAAGLWMFSAPGLPRPKTRVHGPGSEITLLVISDMHNNLEAMEKVAEIARRRGADAVIDAGDLTDFGTSSETAVVRLAGKLGVPHVFVAGNHDSLDTINALKREENTLLPDDRRVSVAGLRVIGQHDPASRSRSPHPVTSSKAEIGRSRRRLASVMQGDRRPDVIVVHRPEIAERFAGQAVLIVDGHVHQASVRRVGGSVIVNPGSAGAAGLRYVTEGRVDRMTLAVVRLSPTPSPKVRRVDIVSINVRTGKESVRTYAFASKRP